MVVVLRCVVTWILYANTAINITLLHYLFSDRRWSRYPAGEKFFTGTSRLIVKRNNVGFSASFVLVLNLNQHISCVRRQESTAERKNIIVKGQIRVSYTDELKSLM